MNYKTGERLAKYRKKANMSQEELADKLNVSRQAVSKWERGESSPDTDNLIALASLYNITLDDLLNKDPDETNRTARFYSFLASMADQFHSTIHIDCIDTSLSGIISISTCTLNVVVERFPLLIVHRNWVHHISAHLHN